MIKTILASLNGFGSDRNILDAAVAIAKADGAHIDCIHTRIDTAEMVAWVDRRTVGYDAGLQKLAKEIVQKEIARAEYAQAEFQDACRRHSLTISMDPGTAVGISIAWKELKGSPNETVVQAWYHDLIVMARTAELSGAWIQNVLMKAGRPVLLTPEKPVETIGRRVAIAWKPGPEAARAMTAASSILSSADRIILLVTSEDDAHHDAINDAAEYLAQQLQWHGIQAEVKTAAASWSISETIKTMAYNCGADLLVMGAYGHSRMREFVSGGVTHDVLADCAIPVFMFH